MGDSPLPRDAAYADFVLVRPSLDKVEGRLVHDAIRSDAVLFVSVQHRPDVHFNDVVRKASILGEPEESSEEQS